jgi:hypothetical protein
VTIYPLPYARPSLRDIQLLRPPLLMRAGGGSPLERDVRDSLSSHFKTTGSILDPIGVHAGMVGSAGRGRGRGGAPPTPSAEQVRAAYDDVGVVSQHNLKELLRHSLNRVIRAADRATECVGCGIKAELHSVQRIVELPRYLVLGVQHTTHHTVGEGADTRYVAVKDKRRLVLEDLHLPFSMDEFAVEGMTLPPVRLSSLVYHTGIGKSSHNLALLMDPPRLANDMTVKVLSEADRAQYSSLEGVVLLILTTDPPTGMHPLMPPRLEDSPGDGGGGGDGRRDPAGDGGPPPDGGGSGKGAKDGSRDGGSHGRGSGVASDMKEASGVISLQTLHALRRLVPMPQLWPPAQGAAFTLLGGYLEKTIGHGSSYPLSDRCLDF